MIDTAMQAATEAMLGLLLFFGATGVFALAIEAVRRAHSAIHPSN